MEFTIQCENKLNHTRKRMVQEILFSFDYGWRDSGKVVKKYDNLFFKVDTDTKRIVCSNIRFASNLTELEFLASPTIYL